MLAKAIAVVSVLMFFVALCCVCIGGIIFR